MVEDEVSNKKVGYGADCRG